MSEADIIIDAAIESRLEVHAGYSPFLNRWLHTSERELEQRAKADVEADAVWRARNHGTICTCYPRSFVSEGRAVQEQLKAEHIAAGVHLERCPMFKHREDYEPWSFRLRHDVEQPSYTVGQQRADAEAEALDR